MAGAQPPKGDPHEPAVGLDRSSLHRAMAGRFSDWLTRMEKLSHDTMGFDAALQETGRDLLLTYFGDHQPNFEGEVPLLRGLDEPRYLTRFAIRGPGRDSVRAGPTQVLDVGFLGSLLLEHAGIPRDEFFTANAAMRQLCGGTLLGCRDSALVESYRAFLYHDLSAADRPPGQPQTARLRQPA